MRCSSNLNRPTDNLREIDNSILNQVNTIVKYFFKEQTELNHVLAQIYENTSSGGKNKNSERKAKIGVHSDKTKYMPKNGLIAFCTFYKNFFNDQFNTDELKHIKKGVSVLTRLRFKLKNMVTDTNLKENFDIVLYPNSVFIISLHTNRLYTHEIVPSELPIDKIPTRMGYVIRCSNTDAIFKNNQTYIIDGDNEIKLLNVDREGHERLKELYRIENTTDQIVEYKGVNFSLNNGDYTQPIL